MNKIGILNIYHYQKKADIIVVAPATADVLARLSVGRAEDLLSSTILATRSPVLLCPSMNENMWTHSATKANVNRLSEYGYNFVLPQKGDLACGDNGVGRLSDLQNIFDEILKTVK